VMRRSRILALRLNHGEYSRPLGAARPPEGVPSAVRPRSSSAASLWPEACGCACTQNETVSHSSARRSCATTQETARQTRGIRKRRRISRPSASSNAGSRGTLSALGHHTGRWPLGRRWPPAGTFRLPPTGRDRRASSSWARAQSSVPRGVSADAPSSSVALITGSSWETDHADP
jgi:hypothetical protein